MKDIIDAIISIEGEADEIYHKAKAIDSGSDRLYKEAIDDILRRKEERIKNAAAKKEEEERLRYEEKIRKINEQKEITLKKMSEYFDSNKNSIVDRLYKKVLEQ
jgi:pyruvate/2-oxoacid:ferredoxin oxidoreductase beta subunit